ncbi:polysaccharide pyruvyl transferase family protein, partial [Candidatus Saccharibacteria bacterium]|nr:polysaccharide pyruvyl transferase family protein [Candidatus Saccharibacteria bacterium]
MRRYNIIQVGSFDVENYGDLLFPVVFEHEIKKRLNLDNLFLFSPNGGRMPFYDREVYSTAELDDFCAKHKIDGIVVGGGDTVRLDSKVLKDYPESFIPSLSMWQYPIFVANKYNLPVVFNCPGVPLDFGINQSIVDYTMDLCPYLSVRDRNAKNTFSVKNAKKIEVVLDSVNLIDEVYPKKILEKRFLKLKNTNKIEERFIVLQVNNIQGGDEQFIQNLAELVNLINEKYDLQVVFSPIGYVHDDLECLKKIYARVKARKRNVMVTQKMSPEDMLALFSHSAGFIGTSLHGLITSNVYHVPILGIDTQNRNKISGYAELCGIENRLVRNISEVKNVFEVVFFEKINYTKLETERAKIAKHFDKIANLIKDQVTEKDTGQMLNIFDEFYKITQFSPKSIFVNYITDEANKTRFVYGPKKGETYYIDNVFNSNEIHISFFNHSAIKI